MSAALLLSTLALTQLPTPRSGLMTSADVDLVWTLSTGGDEQCPPDECDLEDAPPACPASLEDWPYRLEYPRPPRPHTARVLPEWPKFTSINDCLDHCQTVLAGGISDGNLRVCRDYEHYYGTETLLANLTAIAMAAPLANSRADCHIRDWYQRHARSRQTDDWALTGKQFGQPYMLGVYVGALLVGKMTESCWAGAVTHEWADRCWRGVAVGAPTLLFQQFALGGSRPIDGKGSRWRPFQDDNSASGHTFMGAIPFLTAASMTENRMLRGALVAASSWTAWSRINDDQHYLSQVLLGWYFAYQAVHSVNRTESEERRALLMPYFHHEGAGIALHLRY